MVTAHRVSARLQGAFDSARTDAQGRFRFRVARPESATVYVLSTEYAGIGYFSEPFTGEARTGADSIALVVFDTASAGAPLGVAIRHLVVEAGAPGGDRRVLDLIEVANADSRTRIGADSTATVWSMRLPDGVRDVAVGQGEIPASAVRFPPGRVEVAAAFPPGTRQVVLTYTLPAGEARLRIPVDQPTARLEVLVEGANATADGSLEAAEPMEIENRTFSRFAAGPLAAGVAPAVRLNGPSGRGPWWIAVVLAGVVMAGAMVMAIRRRPSATPDRAVPAETDESPDTLIAAIVALDARYEHRRAEVSPAEWAEYQQRRADLKSRLARRVAPA